MSHILQKTGPNDWLTPEWILDAVRGVCDGTIALDPCTAPWNPTKALNFYTEKDDGLSKRWTPGTFWNPPFGCAEGKNVSQCYAWAEKARAETKDGNWSIALLPCDTGRQSTELWQEHVLCDEVVLYCIIEKRVNFDRSIDGERVTFKRYKEMLKASGKKAPGGATYSCGLYLYASRSLFGGTMMRRFANVMAGIGTVMPGRLFLEREGF